MSLEPAVAALTGYLILSQALTPREIAGIALGDDRLGRGGARCHAGRRARLALTGGRPGTHGAMLTTATPAMISP